MKTLSRTLAMIISLQLAVGCTGSEMYSIVPAAAIPVPGVDVSEDDSISIEGSISRTFNTLSNLILPSAVAADGRIDIYDVSSPDDEKLLHQEEIDGTAYSVKLKHEQVDGKLLKIKYESYNDESLSRDLLIEADVVDKKVSASLDEMKSYKSKMLEAKLRREIDSGDIDKSGFIDRYKELKDDAGEEELNFLGDQDLMLQIFKRPELAKIASDILAAYSLSKNSQERYELLSKLANYSYKYEVIKHPLLVCNGQEASVLSPDNGEKYFITIAAANKEGLEIIPSESEYDSFGNPDEARKFIEALVDKIVQVSKDKEVNFGVKIRIKSEKTEVASCNIYGLGKIEDGEPVKDDGAPVGLERDARILNAVNFEELGSLEEGEKLLEEAFHKTMKELYGRMIEAKLEDGSEEWNKIWDEQYGLNKEHHAKRYEEMKIYFDGGSSDAKAKAAK